MALRRLCGLLASALVTIACGAPQPAEPQDPGPEPLSVTRWTGKTELFAEYPPLVAGQTSRFAIHLTRLDTFKAITAGRVEVQLRGGNGAAEVFAVDGPSRPGIFGVDVRPSVAGKRELVIRLRSAGLEDEHIVTPVDIHRDAAAAQAAAVDGEDADGIGFLKEQQWALDFATDVVREQAVQENLQVSAEIAARPGGSADVVSPINGRLASTFPGSVGASVTRGQELGRLAPPGAVSGDLPQLEGARAEAQAGLELAVRDRERAERLSRAGATPQKRLDEALAVEKQAQARVTAANASLAQYNIARGGGGGAGAENLFILRAPVSGVIADRDATTGANITAGAVLFRIVDASQVHVVGHVPEADVARARAARSAEIEIPGRMDRVPAGRLATMGKVLNPQSRTVPIIFDFDNRAAELAVGQAVSLHLLMEATKPKPVVPAAAIVDDAGRPVVFVQREGETFERRPVTLGARAGQVVQILEGLSPGDRVVTTGAYLVRLASLSMSAPAQGHVH